MTSVSSPYLAELWKVFLITERTLPQPSLVISHRISHLQLILVGASVSNAGHTTDYQLTCAHTHHSPVHIVNLPAHTHTSLTCTHCQLTCTHTSIVANGHICPSKYMTHTDTSATLQNKVTLASLHCDALPCNICKGISGQSTAKTTNFGFFQDSYNAFLST